MTSQFVALLLTVKNTFVTQEITAILPTLIWMLLKQLIQKLKKL